jgi:hypothetical protein
MYTFVSAFVIIIYMNEIVSLRGVEHTENSRLPSFSSSVHFYVQTVVAFYDIKYKQVVMVKVFRYKPGVALGVPGG